MFKHYKSFLFTLIGLIPAFAQAQTDTLAFWNFESRSGQVTGISGMFGPITPEIGNGNLIRNNQNTTYSIVYSNPGNGSARSLHVSNWGTIGDYLQCEVNTLGKSGIQIKFEQASSSTAGPRDFKIAYSTDGANFTDLPNGNYMQTQMNPTWNTTTVQSGYTYSFTLPAALNNISNAYLRISVTSNIAINGTTFTSTSTNARFDNILVTGTSAAPATQITNVVTNTAAFCNAAASPVSVSFNTSASTTATYIAQLSDASGNFTTPVTIGSGTTSPIAATIPSGTAAGSGYRIRVVEGTSISQNTAGPITINQAISITQQPASMTICEGGIANFNMLSSNTQAYQWLYNGNPVANNSFSNNYTVSAVLPAHAGNYSVALSNGACRDTTNNAVLTVNLGTMPANTTVSGSRFVGGNTYFPIITNNGNCGRLAMINALNNNLANTTVSVTAGAPQQSGTTGPWHVGRAYTITPTNAPTNNVAISFYFSPQDFTNYNLSAPATQQIVANQTAQTISNLYFSKLTNLANLGTGTVITPDSVSFQNGYWKVFITSNSFSNADTFFAHGNNFTPCPTPTISITESANTVCAGTTVNYTATITNQGTTPTYQWQVNGANVGTAATYSYTPADGDTIKCILTNADCFQAVRDTSNTITMQVSPTVTPDIAITADNNNSCLGTAVTYTATANNTGTAPVYQWKVNGGNMGTNATTFVHTPANGDLITCELSSNATCLSISTPVASNTITAAVSNPVAAEISLTASPAGNATVGQPIVYTADVSGTTTYRIDWYVNSQLVLQQQNPDNTYTRAAAAVPDTVYAKLNVEGCFTDTTYTSNELIVTTSTNIPELAINLGLKFYPNPADKQVTIALNQGDLKEVQLINVLGQAVQTEVAANGKQHAVNLANNAAGIYYVKVRLSHQGKDYIVVEKIIKK